MATTVYVLCALASIAVAALLVRGYTASRARLLLWSSVAFAWLAVNNIVLFVDRVIVTGTDLSLVRALTALVGVVVLLVALIWEAAG